MAWTTPKSWTIGEQPTAATMNTHLRDNLLALNTDNDWQPLQLLNGWVSYSSGYGPARIKMQGGRVFMAGLITGGTFTPGTAVANIPAGYRPPIVGTDVLIIKVVPCFGKWMRIDLNGSTGNVTLNERDATATNGWLSLHTDWVL